MTKLDNNAKQKLELFQEPTFTEHEFVAILLPLLCKNGIHQINEQELSKKLYYYYKNGSITNLMGFNIPLILNSTNIE